MNPSRLILKSGPTFEGFSPSWQRGDFFGEVVFTTGMTGYVESLTDPSFAGQILVFTFPLIGNYGVPEPSFWESKKIQVSGVIVAELCTHPSHFQSRCSLLQWLQEQKIPLMTAVDTRALTIHLRTKGTALGVITPSREQMPAFVEESAVHFVSSVSCKEPILYGKGKKRVIAVDCGMKENIMRHLLQFPIEVKRVPYDYDYTNEDYDGIFISNGPGDPMQNKETIAVLQKAMRKTKPIFGICLGAQMLALSIGARTYKLHFGHRGHNQPCIDTKTKKCYLTSQNHGYAVDEGSLPGGWEVSWRNLNDQTIEGIAHKDLPFFAVQFHPEAAPGPTDSVGLFKTFYQML